MTCRSARLPANERRRRFRRALKVGEGRADRLPRRPLEAAILAELLEMTREVPHREAPVPAGRRV
jgi:hypothetical protein